MLIETANALPLNSGSQMARSTATSCLKGYNMIAVWQISALLSNSFLPNGSTQGIAGANAAQNCHDACTPNLGLRLSVRGSELGRLRLVRQAR